MTYRAYMAVLTATSLLIVAALFLLLTREDEPASHRVVGADLVALNAAVVAGTVATPSDDKVERAAPPVRIVIPAIGVVAGVTRLGLKRDGTLEVPSSYSDAGWWSGGFKPGQTGPSVIAGHVDSKTGPAVFANLRELERGDAVHVFRADGTMVEFEVKRIEEHSKDEFPTKGVYGETLDPELRLLTCSGEFDDSSGHYDQNVIVWASRRRI
jgi:LPXTG-site transpeptidase (sortase) family protein